MENKEYLDNLKDTISEWEDKVEEESDEVLKALYQKTLDTLKQQQKDFIEKENALTDEEEMIEEIIYLLNWGGIKNIRYENGEDAKFSFSDKSISTLYIENKKNDQMVYIEFKDNKLHRFHMDN